MFELALSVNRNVKITDNGFALGEGGEQKVLLFKVGRMLIESTTDEPSTNAPLLPNACYANTRLSMRSCVIQSNTKLFFYNKFFSCNKFC